MHFSAFIYISVFIIVHVHVHVGPFEKVRKNDPIKVPAVAARKPMEERKRVVLKPRVKGGDKVMMLLSEILYS